MGKTDISLSQKSKRRENEGITEGQNRLRIGHPQYHPHRVLVYKICKLYDVSPVGHVNQH